MNRVEVRSKVGPDGVLHLDVPVGASEANREVRVIIEEISEPADVVGAREDWQEFLQRTAGAWQGEFERPAQGKYEQRDELS